MTREETKKRKSQLGWFAAASFAAALLGFVFTRLSGSSLGFYAMGLFVIIGCVLLSCWDGKKQLLKAMDAAAEKDRELEEMRAIVAEPQYAEIVRAIKGLDTGGIVIALDAESDRELMWIVRDRWREEHDFIFAREVTGQGEDYPALADVIRMREVRTLSPKSSVFAELYRDFWQKQQYDPRRDGGGIQDP